MYSKQPDIASLISSRICHDLVSPLGAISNGLELIGLSGSADGPEYDLINDSVANATARINFFRYAFGSGSGKLPLTENNLRSTLGAFYADSRIKVQWNVHGDVPRREAKLALLLLQCLESFLPIGGTISVDGNAGTWQLTARGDRLKLDEGHLAHLLGIKTHADLKPSEIQFELARQVLEETRIEVDRQLAEGEFGFSYRFPTG